MDEGTATAYKNAGEDLSNTVNDLSELNNKKVLYVTTKNLDYIRCTQEIRLLENATKDLSVIGTESMSYPVRLIKVWSALLFTSFKKYDVVFVGFAPQLMIPIFGRRMKRSGCKIYEDFFVSLYDTMCCDRRRFRPDSIVGKWMHRIDERTFLAADKVICDTKAHADYFAREFGTGEESLNVLYLEADNDIYRIHGLDRKETLKRIPGFDDYKKPVVLYFGSVNPHQGTEIVYEAMTKLTAVGGYTCIFVGPRKNLSVPHFCNEIYQIDWLKQEDLAALIEISDICLAGHFNADIGKAKRTIPGKAFIYEAMGKTMVLGDSPANREYFTEDSRHIFVPMSDADAIVDSIRKIAE